ncbi:hypothetical protein DFR31_1445 [Alkalispirillum mobile]|uniref:Uncharacterized protein n=1 Tax=Alkalispirillum mobile TaxID=85925 RepID=A0A498C7W7_9GAMM|nr:hypothetical protein [Alkalispirillum mobile]RLK51503.1 hypothetical protein DFR31_1445 [Alkalispirillum mobile]
MDERLQLHPVENIPRLRRLIASVLGSSTTESLGPYPQLEHACLHLHRSGTVAAVVQRQVQDPDFLAEHGTYYSRWAYAVPRFCTRIHFFSAKPKSADVLEAIDGWAEAGEDVYLGFITLRPVANSPVAASFMRKPSSGWGQFIRTYDRYPVNLSGRQFHVDATPFMQQDNAVGACAQASIWMALRTLRWKEGRSAFNPADITSAATRFMVSGRTLPNRDGLRIEQITEAIRTAGYSPHVIYLRKPGANGKEAWEPGEYAKVCRTLYPYIESGIPVILALLHPSGGHAVVAIGHGWSRQDPAQGRRPQPVREKLAGAALLDASQWAHPYYIHNDNTGPYLELTRGPGSGYTLANAFCAIPLLSSDILVDADEARTATISLLNDVMNIEKVRKMIDLPSRLVTRTLLLARTKVREQALASNLNPAVKRYYRTKWLPSHIWSLELHPAHDYGNSPTIGLSPIGEVLLDPSADPSEGHFLTIRINGAILKNHPETTDLIIDRNAFDGSITLALHKAA